MAIAFVSNQRFYDTIYQERYMGLPEDNEEGYKNGSPITFAHQLEGHLLIVPIEHRLSRHELTYDEHAELYKIEKIVRCIFQKRIGEGIEDLQYEKNGATLQSVNHFHIHVIPIDKTVSSFVGKMKLAWMLFVPKKALTDEELEKEKRESEEAGFI